ncbi:hypothetical protein SAY86_008320 [Trapa natans]|uniref:Uncharacterized protein n=1 Tax=Trapa natans TaxID=22666 RepID=A0AAN7K9Y9_TRANT|nr:hypothetical protein SAY86_008320 [Trapa natans]
MVAALRRLGSPAYWRGFSTACEGSTNLAFSIFITAANPQHLLHRQSGLHIALESDPRPYVFGEDVSLGRVFRCTTGLADDLGKVGLQHSTL